MENTRKNVNEHAVSPVVGVMLMLVVVIIIAAVVSAFAGGLMQHKDMAPQASFDCHIGSGGMMGNTQFVLKHLGGDPINTKNIRLVTSWANATGMYHIQATVAPEYVDTPEQYLDNGAGLTASAHYKLSSLNTHYLPWSGSGNIYYNEPYLVVPGILPAANNETTDAPLWFGNYIMRAGDVIKADINLNPGSGIAENQATPIIKDVKLLTGNDIVNVKLIDLKSDTIIYEKNIVTEV